jgi:hypothetical protein
MMFPSGSLTIAMRVSGKTCVFGTVHSTPFFLEHSAHATEITDHKTQAPDAELLVQTNGPAGGTCLGPLV